jgi:hypothetical protein
MLTAGSSVALTEDELNLVFAAPVEKGKPASPAALDGLIVPGVPNFRFVDGQLQIGVPCMLNVYGFRQEVLVTAVGGFQKGGDGPVFAPDKFYVGSLPVSRLPAIEGIVTKKIIAAEPLPDDLVTAWKKLSAASVDGGMLKLTM